MSDTVRKAVILLSGGLDSATALAVARSEGFECHAMSVAYGQRHGAELDAARRVAESQGVASHRVIDLDLSAIGGSALTDDALDVPETPTEGIPITYVPARNTVFLSLALAWAEVLGAGDLYVGVNAVDYSGYPDCRPEFIRAFEKVANLGTRAGVDGDGFRIHAPLIDLSKGAIVALGAGLGVDYGLTVSCYQAGADGSACGRCDSCRIRADGFRQAGVSDPTNYRA
ncbi:MAG: 7-cyano-7-deazaguanine synthase QueC [Gammaproteobacteria bacterium]